MRVLKCVFMHAADQCDPPRKDGAMKESGAEGPHACGVCYLQGGENKRHVRITALLPSSTSE